MRQFRFLYAGLAFIGSSALAAGAAGAVNPPAQVSPPTGVSTAAPASAPMSANQVLQMLDQTVDWYRMLATPLQAANQASDLLIVYENRQFANEVTRLAFEVARANADLLAQGSTTTPERPQATASPPALAQLSTKLDAQEQSTHNELEAERRKLAAAHDQARPALKAKIAELQGELDLIKTKKSILSSIAGFENQGADNSSASELRTQIDAMAVALPAVVSASAAAPSATSPATTHAPAATTANPLPPAPSSVAASRFGLWDLAAEVFRLSGKVNTIDVVDKRSAALQTSLNQIRTRLVEQMKSLSTRGDALAMQADTADGAALNQVRDQMNRLATQFKQASAILIPLSKEDVLLNQYRRNLENWRDAAEKQYRDALKTFGVRVGILGAVLAVVFAFAELWRRAVLRYVQDSRRRYQLMLLRRIALGSLVVVIVGFAFASELGSLVTFAGLITAGLAVAMQSVLVSIVGYFFLIGKYGIRVGDRVQIGEVNGEVIDLGLVRMYLMEFGGHGSLGPTGRLVAFANSVVFQVSTGLFKQIPGVNVTWHEVTLSIPAAADYASAKEKLYAAVVDALKDYRDEIQRQTREIQRATVSNSGGDALPTVQLKYSANGVEAHVRYPVHLQHAAEIDERVSRALLKVISDLTPPAAANASLRS